MSALSSSGLFTLAAAFAISAAAMVWQAFEAVRWRDARRFWTMLIVSAPLAAAAYGASWLALRNPYANFWSNAGFGPDWECGNLGPASGQVCSRDLPPQLQPEPPKRATAPAPAPAN
jgi:hypothetical protein